MSRADFDYFQKDEVFHGYRIERLLGRGGIVAVFSTGSNTLSENDMVFASIVHSGLNL